MTPGLSGLRFYGHWKEHSAAPYQCIYRGFLMLGWMPYDTNVTHLLSFSGLQLFGATFKEH